MESTIVKTRLLSLLSADGCLPSDMKVHGRKADMTDSDPTTYNGILHYETWTITHWLESNPSTRTHWARTAVEVYRQCRDHGDPVLKLSELLESWHHEKLPIVGGLYADLLRATLRRVDWNEIAINLLAKVDETAIATTPAHLEH